MRKTLPLKLMIIFVLLFLSFTISGALGEAETPILTCETNSITVENGKSKTVLIHFENLDATNLAGWIYNTNILNGSFGAISENTREVVVTGCGAGESKISVYLEDNPDISVEFSVKVTMSAEEKKNAKAVQYISDRSFFYYENEDAYVVQFSLMNEKEERIKCPAEVDIKIVNEQDETVFEETRYVTMKDYGTWTSSLFGERLCAAIYILPEDIKKGKVTDGTVYFTVRQPNYWTFEETQVSTYELPKIDLTEQCSLLLPDAPITVSYKSSSGKLYSKVSISKMNYSFEESYDGKVSLTIYFTGQKTYDYKGDNSSSSCKIGWKLYDEDGYVVKSGTAYTADLETGEKFKDSEETIYGLEPGQYTLKILDAEL